MQNLFKEEPFNAPTERQKIAQAIALLEQQAGKITGIISAIATMVTGIVAIALIIPVFLYRHYVTDRGQYPKAMLEDLRVDMNDPSSFEKKAGVLPYLTISAGILVVTASNIYFG